MQPNNQQPQGQQRPVQQRPVQQRPMQSQQAHANYGQQRPVGQPQQRPIQKQQMPAQQAPAKKTKKKHYWWRYLLFTLLGAVIGIGGIAGGVYVAAAKVPAKQVLTLVGQDPDKILTEEYQNDSIVVLITKFTDGTIDITTLGGISDVTPIVDSVVDEISVTVYEYLGADINKGELYEQKINEIGAYLVEWLKEEVTLEALIGIEDPAAAEQIVQYLCYPKNADGEFIYEDPRTIGQLLNGFADGTLLNNATLSDLLVIDDPESPLYPFKDITVANFKDDFQNILNDMKISDLISIDVTDPNCPPFMASLVYNEVTVGGLSDYINDELRFADVVSPGDNKLINVLIEKNPLVSQIADTVSEIKISEIIDIDSSSPRIVQAIADWKLSELSSKFGTLTIGDLFSTSELESNKFLSSISPSTLLTDMASAINDLKVVDVFAEEIWGTSDHETAYIDGTWKYLLLHGLDDTSEAYRDYRLSSSMGIMMNNMKYNMEHATVNQLLADEMISVPQDVKDGLLQKNSMAADTAAELLNPTGAKYGDLSVSEFIERLSWFVNRATSVF